MLASATAGHASARGCARLESRGTLQMKFSGIAASLVIAASVAAPHSARAQSASAGQAASCAPAGDLHFVCGLTNVEDFLPVEGGRWLVGGSYKPGSVGLYLIDTAAKTAIPVSLSITAKTDPIYHCAAPDLKGLSATAWM